MVFQIVPRARGGKTITYFYDAAGNKLRRVSPNTGSTDYIGGIQYDQSVGATLPTISFIQTEEGKAVSIGGVYNYTYYLSDHLGNTRVAFDAKTGVAVMSQQDDYYPFGYEISRGTVSNPKNQYLYNKKELQEELQQYDYGARFYDPVVARWTSVDPMAEKSPPLSPYNYVAGNPVLLDDPNGMDWSISANQDKDGNWHINITVNAAIYNRSGKKIDMKNYIKNQTEAFKNIFSKNDKGYSVTAKLNLREVSDLDQVKDNEHLVEISNGQQQHFDKDEAGEAMYGGLKVDLNSAFINADGTAVNNAALSHEIGHTGGLIHPFEDKTEEVGFTSATFLGYGFTHNRLLYDQIKGVDWRTNFMSYPGAFISTLTSEGGKNLLNVYKNPGHATTGQIKAIVKYYQNGDLNKNNK